MNQIADILCRAKVLYASAPSHASLPDHPAPKTNCVISAIVKVTSSRSKYDLALDAFADANCILPSYAVTAWNAEHSTAEVLAAFDRAIAAQRLVVPPLQRTERRDPVHAGQES